jgi:hypothetical protein
MPQDMQNLEIVKIKMVIAKEWPPAVFCRLA